MIFGLRSSPGLPPPIVVGTTSGKQAASSSSWAVALPSGIQAGDILIAVAGLGSDFYESEFSGVSGWTTLAETNREDGSIFFGGVVISKVAVGGDSLTFTTNGSMPGVWATAAVRFATGVAEIATYIDTVNTTTYGLPALTPATPGKPAVLLYLALRGPSRPMSSWPAGFTKNIDYDSTDSYGMVSILSKNGFSDALPASSYIISGSAFQGVGVGYTLCIT